MKLTAKGLLALLVIASYATFLRAQTIQIKLVDGKTGLPWQVPVWARVMKDARNKMSLYIPMDKNGIARLHLTQKE